MSRASSRKTTTEQRQQRLAETIAEDLGAEREPTEEQLAAIASAFADLVFAKPSEMPR